MSPRRVVLSIREHARMTLDPQLSEERAVLAGCVLGDRRAMDERSLDRLFREGYSYKRAGVVIEDIVAADAVQLRLFESEEEREMRRRQDEISAIMDKVNKPGSNLLRLATQRPGHYADGIRREFCSPLFTTDWNDLLEVKG